MSGIHVYIYMQMHPYLLICIGNVSRSETLKERERERDREREREVYIYISIHARPTHTLAILHRQTVQHMCVHPSSWERMGAQILVSTCNAFSSSSLPHVHKNHDNNLLSGQFSSEVRLLR